ncbi:hypothetical protein K8I31_04775, partial [bacterium]|nr:hypothetical protein [bacterium]
EYSDRILFGTDVGKWSNSEETQNNQQRYFRCFQILETDQNISGGFFSQTSTRGLDLPRVALENIYYKNAMRIYPRVKDSLLALGYAVD